MRKYNIHLYEFIKDILSGKELSLDQMLAEAKKRGLKINLTKQEFTKFINIKCRDFIAVREIKVPRGEYFGFTRALSMYSIKPKLDD